MKTVIIRDVRGMRHESIKPRKHRQVQKVITATRHHKLDYSSLVIHRDRPVEPACSTTRPPHDSRDREAHSVREIEVRSSVGNVRRIFWDKPYSTGGDVSAYHFLQRFGVYV